MDDAIQNTLTIIIASYAALVSTAVLLWDLYKWRTGKRHKLSITGQCGMKSNDKNNKNTYITIRVVNVGEKPVKLHMISYEFYKNKPIRIFGKLKPDERGIFNMIGYELLSNPLPHRIDVGEDWTCNWVQTKEHEEMIKRGYFYILANDSTTKDYKKMARTRLEPVTQLENKL